MSSSRSNIYMVSSEGGNVQGYKFKGSAGFAFSVGDEFSSTADSREGIPVSNWGLPEPCLICLLSGRKVPGCVCNTPAIISINSIRSPYVVAAGVDTS
jgi:hypothetical protein